MWKQIGTYLIHLLLSYKVSLFTIIISAKRSPLLDIGLS